MKLTVFLYFHANLSQDLYMKNIYISVLLVVLSIMSCSKDDGVTPDPGSQNPEIEENGSITYFTLNVNEYWLNDNNKLGFIVINNDEGKLIDFKKIENNTQYVFKAKKEEAMDKFTVTKFVQIGSENFHKRGDTYYNVKQGAEWNFSGKASTTNTGTPPKTISFDLKIENISGLSDYDLSGFESVSSVQSGSTLDLSISMSENQVCMLTAHFTSETSKYIILDAVKDGDIITLNKNELSDFDSYITINLPNDGYTYTKNLYADYKNTYKFLTYSTDKITPLISDNTLGLLDELSNYDIYIETSDSEKNMDYLYWYASMSPKDIDVPAIDIDFSVVNNTFEGFKIETNKNYNIKTSVWSHNINSDFSKVNSWLFYSDEQDYNKIPELPTELLNAYPDFEVENLEYVKTVLYRRGRIYSDIMENSNDQDVITESFTFNNPGNKNKISRINDLYDTIFPWE